MDKYIEVICSQNPTISLPCGNPDCKKTTEIDTSEFVKDFSAQLKKLGFTVK